MPPFRTFLIACLWPALALAGGAASQARTVAEPDVPEMPNGARAAPRPAPPADGYAWEDLAQRAAARSPGAQAARLDAMADQHQVAVDTAWRDPQVRLGSRWGDMDDADAAGASQWETRSSEAYQAGLRMYIVNPFVNHWIRRRGEANARARNAAAEETAYAAYCEVRSLCLEAAALQEELAWLEQVGAWRAQARDLRSQQAAAGFADALDLIQSVARAGATRADIREKQAALNRWRQRLALLADVPAADLKVRALADTPAPDASGWDEAELVQLAESRRPDLLRMEHEQQAAGFEIGAAKARRLPWFDYVEGTYADENTRIENHESGTSASDLTEREGSEWQMRLAVNVPLFDWRGERVRLSQAHQDAVAARLAALQAELKEQIAGTLEEYRRTCAERNRVAQESRQVLEVMNAKIAEMEAEPTAREESLLAAREDAASYARILSRAQLECLRLAQQLESLCGGPLPAVP